METGHGRSDILLKAKRSDGLHVVMEFKQGENLEALSAEALAQIAQNQYDAGLSGEVLLMGIAHNKKDCRIATRLVRR